MIGGVKAVRAALRPAFRARRRLALFAGATLLLAACSGSGVRVTNTATTTTVTRDAGSAVLSCQDSAGQQPADPAATPVNGVESHALAGDTNPYDTLPAWRSADGHHHYLVWKAFVAVAPSAVPYRTVTAVSPATARLFYTSPVRWGEVAEAATVPNPSRRVRLPACGREFTGYTGGILVSGPACVTLAISSPNGRTATVTVPILVAGC